MESCARHSGGHRDEAGTVPAFKELPVQLGKTELCTSNTEWELEGLGRGGALNRSTDLSILYIANWPARVLGCL